MKEYKILALSIHGKYGKSFVTGDKIAEDQLFEKQAQELLAIKAIEEWREPIVTPTKPKENEKI